MHRTGSAQLSFADLDTDLGLIDTTFVVVDLETTGGSSKTDAITEIGAVKVRGGQLLGEFATLVDPGCAIPPQIVQLTGITTAMVRDAPTIDTVLPMFLEFARGAVLVAHNAGFDIGFLKAAAADCGIDWPRPQVLCTVRLSRRVLSREEAPSVRLATLASLFGTACQPTHRALDDARTTVEVLHALIDRVGNQGVHSLGELRGYTSNVTPAQRRKRELAAGVPHRPGVYLFRGPGAEVLYVGTAVDLRRRVGQYFTGSDPRGRIKEMVNLAEAVDHVECAHALEAGVRELRLLAAHAPPYNRRSRFPHRWWWVRLTDEPFPRFSVVRRPDHDRVIGPFRARADAADTAALLARFTGIRTCTGRLGRGGRHRCADREVAPCPAGHDVTAAEYATVVAVAIELIEGIRADPVAAAITRIGELAAAGRFENAARLRDQTATAVDALWRGQRLRALAGVEELVAARPDGGGGWELAVIRRGQLAAAGNAARGVAPMPVVDALCSAAQTVLRRPEPLGGTLVEETGLLVKWLAGPGVRIVRADDGWATPAGAAGRWANWAATARSARLAAEQTLASAQPGTDLPRRTVQERALGSSGAGSSGAGSSRAGSSGTGAGGAGATGAAG